MSKKGENIYKRKDGRWEARYIKGYEPSGKIKYGFCYGKTYREAKEKVLQIRVALKNNMPVPTAANRRCFSFFCGEWLQMQKSSLKESTYVKYDTILEKHIKPRLGSCMPFAVTTQAAEAFKRDLLGEAALSAKTVKDILVVLHSILEYAARQYPGTFPAVEITYPKGAKQEMRVLSLEEQQRFTAYLLTDLDACKFGTLLALLTGMRIGELCALRWKDISTKDKTIRIAASMQRLKSYEPDEPGKTKILIGEPKSSTSNRTIPLTNYATRLCETMRPQNELAFVLTGTTKYMEPRTLQYRLKRYTQACGLEQVHFHTLRHTFATRCVEVGFEIKSLSEILGHASTTITLDRYVHVSMELKRDNMNKLSAIGL